MQASRCSEVALLQNKLITNVKQGGGVKSRLQVQAGRQEWETAA